MNDPAIVNHAPNMARLLSASATTSLDANVLIDRGRGAMLGLAAGNLLGLPVGNCSDLRGSPAFPTGSGRVAKHRICFANRSRPLNREQLRQ